MNKTELIDTIARRTGEPKRAVAGVVEEFIDQVQRAVKKGDRVSLTGFGVFSQRKRAARTARNPRTGEEVQVKATKVPAFRPGASFKTYVAGGRR